MLRNKRKMISADVYGKVGARLRDHVVLGRTSDYRHDSTCCSLFKEDKGENFIIFIFPLLHLFITSQCHIWFSKDAAEQRAIFPTEPDEMYFRRAGGNSTSAGFPPAARVAVQVETRKIEAAKWLGFSWGRQEGKDMTWAGEQGREEETVAMSRG